MERPSLRTLTVMPPGSPGRVAEIVRSLSLRPRCLGVNDGCVALRPHSVVIIAFPDVQALDVVGPLEVFAMAERHQPDPAYATSIVSASGRTITTSSGLSLTTDRAASHRGPIDTLVVAGGPGTRGAMADDDLIGWLRQAADRARRVTSVCSGAFLLAQAGLLDGRRATTHWSACDALARSFPAVEVDADRIYVRDGNVWTSAGVTAGMDLALAMVEQDHGGELALAPPAGGLRPGAGRPVAVQRPAGRATGRAPAAARAAGVRGRAPRGRPVGAGSRPAGRDERAHLRPRLPPRGRHHAGGVRPAVAGRVGPPAARDHRPHRRRHRPRLRVRHGRDDAPLLPAHGAHHPRPVPAPVRRSGLNHRRDPCSSPSRCSTASRRSTP